MIALKTLCTDGLSGLTRDVVILLRKLPGVDCLISMVLDHEVKGAVKLLAGKSDGTSTSSEIIPIPEVGIPPARLMDVLTKIHSRETAAEDGKSFAYTYITVNDMAEFSKCLALAYSTFMESGNSGSASHEQMLADVMKVLYIYRWFVLILCADRCGTSLCTPMHSTR